MKFPPPVPDDWPRDWTIVFYPFRPLLPMWLVIRLAQREAQRYGP